MEEKTKEKILWLLTSGDFTVVGNDSGEFDLVKGRYNEYEDLPEEYNDWDVVYSFYDWEHSRKMDNGYITELIGILVEALRGRTVSV